MGYDGAIMDAVNSPDPRERSNSAVPKAARYRQSQAKKMDERYGNERSNKFAGRLMVVVLLAILVAAAIYIVSQFLNTTSADVTAVESGGKVVSAEQLSMSVDVTRSDASKPAYCIVTALDYDKNEVGRREFLIPAGGAEVTRWQVEINTRKEAYAATVYGCSSTIPTHLQG
ncbi:DUF4307 domain-containing protein [Corynebacterium auriscanis]|nr:DUF4307 domain-containing protein [Corynebacterium auriscanis]MCX2162366.1 DUF4307 domain-containing protein [Corynebacterium auriscanis]WJY73178.1 hypothetical protein CAURIC_07815 [Corynebacterium auriscanis]